MDNLDCCLMEHKLSIHVNVTSTFTDNRNGTYTLTYTVASGHTDINDNGTDLAFESFDFQDGNSITFCYRHILVVEIILSAPGVDQTRPYVTID